MLRGQFIEVNGRRVWVARAGRGQPLVVVPGGPGAAHDFMTPLAALADSCEVIFYDPCGCGKSEELPPEQPYTFAGSLAELEALRVALGFERWAILGQSYGGLVAQEYAHQLPDRVSHLILSSTTHSVASVQRAFENANLLLMRHFPELFAEILRLRAAGRVCSDPEIADILNRAEIVAMIYFRDPHKLASMVPTSENPRMTRDILGADYQFHLDGNVGNADWSETLRALPMPMLILQGRFDRLCYPAETVKYKDFAPQARFLMFDQSGHNPFLEEPTAYLEAIRGFLQKPC